MDLSIFAQYNMRRNWTEPKTMDMVDESNDMETNEDFPKKEQSSLPLSSDKQEQHPEQDRTIDYTQTSPAWPNVVVKDEPQDEKNNDSGVSPDHYSSGTASPNSDCSIMGMRTLSPKSASSVSPGPQLLDGTSSNGNVNENVFDYSRQRQQSVDSSGIPSSEEMSRDASMSPPQQENEGNCNGGQEQPNNVKVNNSFEHPIVNSQGKVKTYRCKQCSFVAVTKRKFWEHSSQHIKPEKKLTCPNCPFVTEYKHHLEYHLRNHFGSKPFKCDKCPYSCVNKSMLNSHLKSHSNVYQFRCAECSYATKYCHSLKLHLRKYGHKPAMVLNADGTPNPLPVIDVYGTKRGPKPKPKKEITEQDEPQPSTSQQQDQPQQQRQTPPSSHASGSFTPMAPPTFPPQFHFNAMNGITSFGGFNGPNALPVATSMSLLGFPLNPIFGGISMTNPFMASQFGNASNDHNEVVEQQQYNYGEPQLTPTNYSQQAMMNGGGIMSQCHQSPINYDHRPSPTFVVLDQNAYDTPVDLSQEPMPIPLDLSNPDSKRQQSQAPRMAAGTSRRKGRAIRLDRRFIQNDSDEEMDAQVVQPQSSQPQHVQQQPIRQQAAQQQSGYQQVVQPLPSHQHIAQINPAHRQVVQLHPAHQQVVQQHPVHQHPILQQQARQQNDLQQAVDPNVILQLQTLRSDMANIYSHIVRLEENFGTRQ